MAFVRRLQVRLDVGIRPVDVTISNPSERNGSWLCRYDIGWPDGSRGDEIWGADALQAIYLCLQAVALTLYASDYHRTGSLYWQRPGDGYGFPMPKAGRMDLVGDDRMSQT